MSTDKPRLAAPGRTGELGFGRTSALIFLNRKYRLEGAGIRMTGGDAGKSGEASEAA